MYLEATISAESYFFEQICIKNEPFKRARVSG